MSIPEFKLDHLFIIFIGATVLFAPLYIIRWSYFGVLPTTLVELLIWATTVMWIVWRRRRKDYSLPVFITIRPFFLLFCISILGVLVAKDSVAALGIARAYFWEPILFAGILHDVLRRQEDPKIAASAFLSVFLLSGVWLAVLGILQAGFGWFIVTEHQVDRAHAVFNNGNALALYLGPIIAMLFGWLYWDRGKKITGGKNIALIAVVLVAGFLLAKSTGGVMALLGVVGMLVFSELAFRVSRKDWNAMLFQGLIAGTLVLSVVLMFLAPRVTREVDNPWVRSGGTAEVRLCVWEGTARLIQDNWLLGVGLSGFKETYSELYVTCDAEPLEYPHNFWMTVGAELGVVGIAGFASVLWFIGGKFRRSRLTNGLFLAFSYFLLHGLVDVPYFKNDLSLIFWVLIALVLVYDEAGKG